jgi:predicted metal-binding protein
MDRSPNDDQSASQTADDADRSTRPTGPVVISVCVSCKAADGSNAGVPMRDAIAAALGGADAQVQLRPVQCLSVCKRPTTVAVSSADGYSFVFGDLVPDTGAEAVAAFATAYRDSNYGLVPWRQRAEVLRKGMVSRLPPLGWSPDDGRAPS